MNKPEPCINVTVLASGCVVVVCALGVTLPSCLAEAPTIPLFLRALLGRGGRLGGDLL